MDVPEEDSGGGGDGVDAFVNTLFNSSAEAGNASAGNWSSSSWRGGGFDRRDHFQFVVYGVCGTTVNSLGFLGNILTLIVLFSMHPRTSVTLYIIGKRDSMG